jgi:hypothetical protein
VGERVERVERFDEAEDPDDDFWWTSPSVEGWNATERAARGRRRGATTAAGERGSDT